MRKALILTAILGLFGLAWAGCGKKEQSEPAASAPADTVETAQAADSSQAAVYACPMHPEMVSARAGKCNECGMDLEKRAAKDIKIAYVCAMNDQGGLPDQPGKCSKCGMDLEKTGVVFSFVCSAHPEQVAAEAGKCAVCGREMKADTGYVAM